jgi:hypothetical protein
MIELGAEDLKGMSSFEPQKDLAIINKAIRKKLLLIFGVCPHLSVQRVKLGDIHEPQFQHLQYGWRCDDCSQVVDPIIAGYRTKAAS